MNNEIMEIEDEKIIVEINGVKNEFDILFTYDSPDVDATYVAFTDNSIDKEGNLVIMFGKASAFTDMKYVQVTDPDELKMLDDIVVDILKKYEN